MIHDAQQPHSSQKGDVTEVVLVSHNPHKIVEMQDMLSKFCASVRVLSASQIDLTDEIEENGSTFEENALIKARAAAQMGYFGIADDSGLSVDALHGAPGVYSARYAGEPCDDHRNNEKLLLALKDVPAQKRGAKFVSVIAFAYPHQPQLDFTACGTCEGVVLTEYRGAGGFGYDPLFYVPEMHKTFAEMNAAEKNSISHRARAMQCFAQMFAARFGTNESSCARTQCENK